VWEVGPALCVGCKEAGGLGGSWCNGPGVGTHSGPRGASALRVGVGVQRDVARFMGKPGSDRCRRVTGALGLCVWWAAETRAS